MLIPQNRYGAYRVTRREGVASTPRQKIKKYLKNNNIFSPAAFKNPAAAKTCKNPRFPLLSAQLVFTPFA